MQKNKCPYCGNNPVPHFLNWYFESLNVLFTPLRGFLIHNFITLKIEKILASMFPATEVVRFFVALRVLSLQHSKEKCKVFRAKVLWDEAERQGIVMTELLLFGKPFDCYLAEKTEKLIQVVPGQIPGKHSKPLHIVFSGLPRPKGYDNSELDTMDDKLLLKRKLQAAMLPVPQGGSAWSLGQALKIFRTIRKPVIVKPRAGSRGRHTTTYVETEADLRQAYRIAKQLCFWVIVEEQLFGPVYRATAINYEIRGVLRGDSPQVIGDGLHTIAQLVEQKNSSPHNGVKDIVLEISVSLFLSRQKKSLKTIPAKGETVVLSEKIGVNYGGSSSEDLQVCHPENKAMFARAAKVAGDPIVGFDFIIPDITQSYVHQHCGFLEANSLPFINLHHDPLLGKPENVARYVWELVDN